MHNLKYMTLYSKGDQTSNLGTSSQAHNPIQWSETGITKWTRFYIVHLNEWI